MAREFRFSAGRTLAANRYPLLVAAALATLLARFAPPLTAPGFWVPAAIAALLLLRVIAQLASARSPLQLTDQEVRHRRTAVALSAAWLQIRIRPQQMKPVVEEAVLREPSGRTGLRLDGSLVDFQGALREIARALPPARITVSAAGEPDIVDARRAVVLAMLNAEDPAGR